MKVVEKYNVTAFFFQLLATKLLLFKFVNKKAVSSCIICDEDEKYLYKNPSNCEGFQSHSEKRGGAVVKSKDLVANQLKAQELPYYYQSFHYIILSVITINRSLISNLIYLPARV